MTNYHLEHCTRLIITSPRTLRFCTISKIHKKGIPERNVISSVDCHTFHVFRYAEHHLILTIQLIPSYIKDINEFIHKVKSLCLPNDLIIVSLDAKSLYTNILNAEDIVAVRYAHKNINKKL